MKPTNIPMLDHQKRVVSKNLDSKGVSQFYTQWKIDIWRRSDVGDHIDSSLSLSQTRFKKTFQMLPKLQTLSELESFFFTFSPEEM